MVFYGSHFCVLVLCVISAISGVLCSVGPKLFDGTDARGNEYTWTVWIQHNGSVICGGALLSRNWVITSGDCIRDIVDNNPDALFEIYVGDDDRARCEITVYRSCYAYYNKNYNSRTNGNNMAVMEIENEITLDQCTNPVPAYSDSKPSISQLKAATCYVTGFGEKADGTVNANRQKVDISVVSPNKCSGRAGYNSATHLCYSTTVGGPCNLDTGAPIVCELDGVETLVASQLDESCRTGFHYGEYTYKNRRFILEALRNPINKVCPDSTPKGCGPAGKSFTVAFPVPDPSYSRPTLYITSRTDTSIVIEAGTDIENDIRKTSYVSTASQGVVIPLSVKLSGRRTGISTYSVRIVADQEIFVMAGYEPDAIGTTHLFPDECLKKFDNTYTLLSYRGGDKDYNELIVVAMEDNTSVTMSAPININVTLSASQVYRRKGDCSGATIAASGPLSVFTGIECGNINRETSFCDTMFEQIPPTGSLQSSYIVPSNLPREGVLIRIVSTSDSTTFSIKNNNGTHTYNIRSARGIKDIPLSSLAYVESNNPIILGAFSFGGNYDFLDAGDPSLLIVPSIEEYTTFYKIYAPPTTGHNYVTLIIRNQDDSTGLLINGAALSGITATQTIDVPLYGLFDVITVLLNYGVNTIEHSGSDVVFGVVQYNLQYYRETTSAPRQLIKTAP